MEDYRFQESDRLNEDAVSIRTQVFVEEQGFVNEFDDTDLWALHLVLYAGDRAAGVCRYYPKEEPGVYGIGRVAVLKEFRGKHLGEKILLEAQERIRKRGGKKICVSAQVRVQDFYAGCGYVPVGDTYMDEFCPHIQMEKIL